MVSCYQVGEGINQRNSKYVANHCDGLGQVQHLKNVLQRNQPMLSSLQRQLDTRVGLQGDFRAKNVVLVIVVVTVVVVIVEVVVADTVAVIDINVAAVVDIIVVVVVVVVVDAAASRRSD